MTESIADDCPIGSYHTPTSRVVSGITALAFLAASAVINLRHPLPTALNEFERMLLVICTPNGLVRRTADYTPAAPSRQDQPQPFSGCHTISMTRREI